MAWKTPLVMASVNMLKHRRGIVWNLLRNADVAEEALADTQLLREMFGGDGLWRGVFEDESNREVLNIDALSWIETEQFLGRLSKEEFLALLVISEDMGLASVHDLVEQKGVHAFLTEIGDENLLEHLDSDQMLGHIEVERILDFVGTERCFEFLGVRQMLEKLGPEKCLEYLSPEQMLDYLEPEQMLGHLEPKRMLDNLGPKRCLDFLGPKHMLDYLEPQQMLSHLGPRQMLEKLGPGECLKYLGYDHILNHLGAERMLNYLGPTQMLEHLDPEQMLNHLESQQLLEKLGPEKCLEYLGPEHMLEYLEPKRMLNHLEPQQMLEKLGPEKCLDYLGHAHMLNYLEPQQMLEKLGPEQCLDYVGSKRMMEHLDPEVMIKNLGAEKIFAALDMDQLLQHIPLPDLLSKIDPDGAGVSDYVADSPERIEKLLGKESVLRQLMGSEHIRERSLLQNAKGKAAELDYALPAAVVCYPRSGSNFIQSIFNHSTGMHNISIYNKLLSTFSPVLTVKSHAPSPQYLEDEFDRLVGDDRVPGRILLLKRDPRDVMISFYEYTKVQRNTDITQKEFMKNICYFYASGIDQSLTRNCEKGPLSVVKAYKKFVQTWFVKRPPKLPVLEVRYEDFVVAPKENARKALNFLKLDMPVAEHSFDFKVSQYSEEKRPRGTAQSWKKCANEYKVLLKEVENLLGSEIHALGYDEKANDS